LKNEFFNEFGFISKTPPKIKNFSTIYFIFGGVLEIKPNSLKNSFFKKR
jgi:hypothetical protein